MSEPAGHTLHSRHHHLVWDNSLEPALRVEPGKVVAFSTLESSGGQIGPRSVHADAARLDFSRVNPVTGPLHVEGAAPGDVLVVSILSLAPSGWGWTAIIPDFGLLAADFPEPRLWLWSYGGAERRVAYGEKAGVPLKPMVGSVGVAPAASGPHDILPPRRVGGTMDIRDLGEGARLYLPVEVEGALLSVGDTHAAQGDGEVCGTGLESAIDVELRVDLVKNTPLAFPRFETPGPVTRHLDAAGYHVTTGIGADLMQGARDAVRGMVELLSSTYALAAEEAYMLCSLAGDLRISEIVDQPSWVVSLYFPRSVFET